MSLAHSTVKHSIECNTAVSFDGYLESDFYRVRKVGNKVEISKIRFSGGILSSTLSSVQKSKPHFHYALNILYQSR